MLLSGKFDFVKMTIAFLGAFHSDEMRATARFFALAIVRCTEQVLISLGIGRMLAN
jgi:hypothetical protein